MSTFPIPCAKSSILLLREDLWSSTSAVAEATAALVSLGYSQTEIGAALKGIDVEALRVEDIVRQALRAMVSK